MDVRQDEKDDRKRTSKHSRVCLVVVVVVTAGRQRTIDGRLGGGEGALVGAFFLRLAHLLCSSALLLLSRLGLLASELGSSLGSPLGLVLPLDYLVSPCFVSCLQPVGRLAGKLGELERAHRTIAPHRRRMPNGGERMEIGCRRKKKSPWLSRSCALVACVCCAEPDR